MSTPPVYRIYTEATCDIEALVAAMDVCIAMRMPFYYSGKRRIIRVQTRNVRKMEKIRRELRGLGLKVFCKTI